MVARENLDPDNNMWHWIAVELYFWRSRLGLSCAQMGEILSLTRGAVSNLEAARHGFKLSEAQAMRLDEHLNLGEHFQRMLRYAKADHSPNWFKQHTQYERRASVLRNFELINVPGLLQTEAYARAQLTSAGQVKDVEAVLAIRLARQQILTSPTPPMFWALLDQSVIECLVGGPQVMYEQLAHLRDLSEWPDVSVRIVPRTAGWYLGMEGPFVVTTVEEGDVAYLEACGGGRLTTDRTEVRRFATRFDRIGDWALPVDASRRLIESTMESLK